MTNYSPLLSVPIFFQVVGSDETDMGACRDERQLALERHDLGHGAIAHVWPLCLHIPPLLQQPRTTVASGSAGRAHCHW